MTTEQQHLMNLEFLQIKNISGLVQSGQPAGVIQSVNYDEKTWFLQIKLM